jgi:hypothetical protein
VLPEDCWRVAQPPAGVVLTELLGDLGLPGRSQILKEFWPRADACPLQVAVELLPQATSSAASNNPA